MKLAVWISICLMLSVPFGMAKGETTDEPVIAGDRHVDILYTAIPPVLDGYIGELEWQTQFTTMYFDAFDGLSFREIYPETGSDEEFTNQADLAVTFYLVYDDVYLYFAANVTDQSIVVDSGTTFWRDDGVELLIDGAHDLDDDQRAGDPWPGYQDGTTLLAKADGSYFYDYSNATPYQRDFGEDADWFVSTRVVPSRNYYIVEMRLRLDSVASPTPNGTIGLNIGINDDDTGGLSKTALKWSGRDTLPGESPTFKNESLWGTGYLKPYVQANLPERIEVDEDVEVTISSNLSRGNHPDFPSGANFTWTIPGFSGGEWKNLSFHGPDLVHTFSEPLSFYSVILDVTDPSGISDRAVTRVYVADITPPSLEFEDAVALEEKPFTYVFNATDNVGVSRIEWSLMDGIWHNTTTVSEFFDHTFEHPGNYTLYFTVFDEANNSANGSARVSVFDDAPPVIDGTLPDIIINTSVAVNITAPMAYDDSAAGPDLDLSYSWSFLGDYGLFRFQGRTVEVALEIPGHYRASLKVTDRIGLSSFLNFNVSVEDDTPPFPAFFLPLEIGEKVRFELNASSTMDNDPAFWNYSVFSWTVKLQGKGSYMDTLEGPIDLISFPFPGTAMVTLDVKDPSGNTANISKETRVLDRTPPVASFVLDREIVDQGELFFLNISGSTDNSGLLAVHYSVVLINGDIEIEIASTPHFGVRILNVTPEDLSSVDGLWIQIEESGEYRIDLMIEDVSGFNDTISAFISVRDSFSPSAVVNRTIVYLELGQMLFLSGAESSDDKGPLMFFWILDNETVISSAMDLEWGLPGLGNYTITLKVVDTGGNMDTAECRVIVTEPSETNAKGTDYTLVYVIWGFAIAIILIGIIILLLWARKRRAEELAKIKEE